VLNRGCREDEGEQSAPVVACASLVHQTGVWSGVVMQGEVLIRLTVGLRTWNSSLLTYLMSALSLSIDLALFHYSLAVPEDASRDFTRRNLHLELFPAWQRLMRPFH
jgi:hypothetical protein